MQTTVMQEVGQLPQGHGDVQGDAHQVPRERGVPQVPREAVERHGAQGTAVHAVFCTVVQQDNDLSFS